MVYHFDYRIIEDPDNRGPDNRGYTVVGKIVDANDTVDITTKNGKKLKKQDCILHDTNRSALSFEQYRITHCVLSYNIVRTKQYHCKRLVQFCTICYHGE